MADLVRVLENDLHLLAASRAELSRFEPEDLPRARVVPSGLDDDAAGVARTLGTRSRNGTVALGVDQIEPWQRSALLPLRIRERAAGGRRRREAALVILPRGAEDGR